MKPMPLEEIRQAVDGKYIQGNLEEKISGVSIDSRTIETGELFIAIIGERFDGHNFISNAVNAGAAAVLVDRKVNINKDIGVIKVADTTLALQDLARYYRKKLKNIEVIGITGSAGKTTTKDMTAALIKTSYIVKKTKGNLNNYYGLPLTILDLNGEEEFAVLEMGMSKLKEIELLADIARPRVGVVTNVGATHLESLGSIENVARGKSELIAALSEEGIAILNYDNHFVREMKEKFSGKKIIYYGLDSKADLSAVAINTDSKGITSFEVDYQNERHRLSINKPGKHNVYNALAAIAVAREYGIDWDLIASTLMEIELSSLRWDEKRLTNGAVIINDTYNANPLAMESAVEAAIEIARGRTITVLGSMLELGEIEKKAHQLLGRFINRNSVDLLITVGDTAKLIADGALIDGMEEASVYALKDNKEAAELLSGLVKPYDTILIKGSRGNKMEEIVESIVGQGG